MSKKQFPHAEQLKATDMESVQVMPFLGGKLAYYTRRMQDKPSVNEDSLGIFALSESQGVLVVADGCGGMQSGELASAIVIDKISEALERFTEGESLRSYLLDALEDSNQAILDLGLGSATTALVVEVDKDNIRAIHAGDSQAMLVGGRGKIKYQSVSHSPVGYAVEAGMIDEQEAIEHEERHVVSNIVGSTSTHFEVGSPRKMAGRDSLLLASDGVFDNLLEAEVAELIRLGSLEQAANRLVAATQVRMQTLEEDRPSKPDDMAFFLFRR